MKEYIRPVPSGYPLTSGYGPRTLNGKKHFHGGVDFGAPIGTPVYAAKSGVIVEADRNMRRDPNGYGRFIAIAHDNGTITFYAHLHQIAPKLEKGTHVITGQTIGQVGTTGASTGPHLHFEIRKNYLFPSTAENTLAPEARFLSDNDARALIDSERAGNAPAPDQE